MRGRIIAFAALSCAGVASNAALTVYDFEEFPGSTVDTTDNRTSLSSTKDGITMTMTRTSGLGFCVLDLPSQMPTHKFDKSWGNRAVSPFAHATQQDFFLCNFSTKLSYIEVEMTDFGGDSDTMDLIAYSGLNGTGSMIGESLFSWGTQSGPHWAGLAIYADSAPIQSVKLAGGSGQFGNSMYVDNIGVTLAAAPEPASLAAIGLGLAGLLARRKK